METLGPYRIQSEIGRGGMGQVYLAIQPALGRRVAVKVLPAHLATSPEFVERFLREARATARLSHPGIVTIHDVGESDGTYYFAMEYLEGTTLEKVIGDEAPMRPERAVAIMREVLAALGHAHARGILHRDVKPSNILIETAGRLVLTDFGIAWAATETRLTQAGMSLGSPDYMSPEHFRGQDLDQRADLYSAGVMFFRMLAGALPFRGEGSMQLAYQHVHEPAPSVRSLNPAVSESLDLVVQKLLSKDPAQRYTSAGETIAALDTALGRATPSYAAPVQTRPDRPLAPAARRPRAAIAVAIAAVVVAAAIVALALSMQPGDRPSARTPRGGAAAPPMSVPGEPQPPAPAPVEAATEAEPEIEEPQAAGDLAAPATPTAETFTITSRPEGASVMLDGEQLAGGTPLTVELAPGGQHRLSLRLAGYEPAAFDFSLEDLSASQRADATLHFPLQASTPPGTLSLSSSYAARVTVAGRERTLKPGDEIELPPGEVVVDIRAAEAFYVNRRTVRIRSGENTVLPLPALAEITVAANPGYCRVRIDGIDAGYLPVTVQIAVGSHEFRFDWETIGKQLTVTRAIRADTGRVFVAAPEDPRRP